MLNRLVQPGGNTGINVLTTTVSKLINVSESDIVYLNTGNIVTGNSILVDPDLGYLWENGAINGTVVSFSYNPDNTINLVTNTGSFTLYRYQDKNKVSTVDTLSDLAKTKAVNGQIIKTRGAFSVGDGGSGEWIFDSSDNTTNVSKYPRLFFPSGSDLTGGKGTWRLNSNNSGIKSISLGVGVTTDRVINTEILNQLMDFNKGIQKILLPAKKIYVKALSYSGNPKLFGVSGVNSELSSSRVMGSLENGTSIIGYDSDSSDPVIKISGTRSARLSGVDIVDIAIISGDLIDNRDLSTNAEWQVRSLRTALKLDFIASKVNINNLTVCGFKRAHYFNEVWDGVIENSAVSICSDADGSVPAIFLGSDDTDNTNNLTYKDVRIEHCPFSLEIGAVNHVRFIGCKIETKRAVDATNYVIKVNPTAISYAFSAGCMFVTSTSTTTPYLYDQGQRGIYEGCFFTGGGITGNYPGIRWIYRNPTGTSNVIFSSVKMNELLQADGTDATQYPIFLANYDTFSGSVSCEDLYVINSINVTPTNQGLISVGTGTKIGTLHIHTNNITKLTGAVFFARNGDFYLGDLSFSGAPYTLITGNYLGSIGTNGAKIKINSAADIEVYGKETIILTGTTVLNSMKGFTGQTVRVMTFAAGSTIKNSSLITNTSSADIVLVANVVYTYIMLSNTVAKQIS